MTKEFKIKGSREFKELTEHIEKLRIDMANSVGKPYVVCFVDLAKYKSLKQNSTFWALIDCFWESGCSSFYDKEEMEDHYYRIANLITIKTKSRIKREYRAILYRAIKLLPLPFTVKQRVYKMLKGEYEKHQSWSLVKKDKARLTIDSLMKDMHEATVNTPKFEEILAGMEKDKKIINN